MYLEVSIEELGKVKGLLLKFIENVSSSLLICILPT